MATQSEIVQNNIAKVKGARALAIDALQGRFLGGEAARASIAAIKAMVIDDWADRGTRAVSYGTPPNITTGWRGWVDAGQIYLDGIHELADMGKSGTLDNITETLIGIERTALSPVVVPVKAVVQTAKKVQVTAQKVSEAASNTAAYLVESHQETVRSISSVVVVSALALALFFGLRHGKK